ncbi:MAG: hypothetical protein PUI23_02705, partial [Bacteroidales bacterium]|nr:hypothetical protein [Bacteroidales bacterium]MDY5225667.1 hypothetical protein [Sodaliphilus sp.]
ICYSWFVFHLVKFTGFQMQRYEKSFTFPQLASFHFLSWQVFTSSVGKFSLPQLACFCFLSWQMLRKMRLVQK